MDTFASITAIGSYCDVIEIGRGSAAVVYRAVQPEFGRDVAIKLVLAAMDTDTWPRFEQECRAIGALSGHPGIVTVYEAGRTENDRPYIVMEYLSGGTLADELRTAGAVPWAKVARIGVRLSAALEVAHQARILHRDIKPANVLISRYGEPKLGDFGIARVHDATQTQTTSFAGTIAYAAPETFQGASISEASDVYSLCATLYALLNGRPPFSVSRDHGVGRAIAMIMQEAPPPLPADVPETLRSVIGRGLAKDPAERPLDAAQLGRQLQAVESREGLPITPLTLPSSVDRTTNEAATRGAASDKPAGRSSGRRMRPVEQTTRERAGGGRRSSRVGRLLLVTVGLLLVCVALVIGALNSVSGGGRAVASVEFRDQFDKPSSIWPQSWDLNLAHAAFDQGHYRMTVAAPMGVFFASPDPGASVGNALDHLGASSVAADMSAASSGGTRIDAARTGPLYGLACRRHGTSGPYYYGVVGSEGYWGIFKYQGGRNLQLNGGLTPALQRTGVWVHLVLHCETARTRQGVHVVLSSGTSSIAATDRRDPIPSGNPGLVVRARDSGEVSVLFDNFDAKGQAQP